MAKAGGGVSVQNSRNLYHEIVSNHLSSIEIGGSICSVSDPGKNIKDPDPT